MAGQKKKRRSHGKATSGARPAAKPQPANAAQRATPAGTAQATPSPKPARAPQPSAGSNDAPVRRAAKVTPQVAPTAKLTRRQLREQREAEIVSRNFSAGRRLGKYGEQPKSIFHPVPVSELATLAGLIGVVVGFIDKGSPALPVGAVVCALGVLEFTARDHFSGYRSHTTLLAAFPAVIVEVLLVIFVGQPSRRILILVPVLPVFLASFWLLSKAFQRARHHRVISSPPRRPGD